MSSASRRADEKSIDSLSLTSAVRGLRDAVENMNYAIGVLEASVSVRSGEFDIPLSEDIISLSGTKSPSPSVEGSPVVAPDAICDAIINVDTVTQVVLDDSGAIPHVDDTQAANVAEEECKSDGPKWYAIAIGREPGVFFGPENVTSNTSGIRGSQAFPYKTEALARARFDQELDAGRVEQVNIIVKRFTRDMIPTGTYTIPK